MAFMRTATNITASSPLALLAGTAHESRSEEKAAVVPEGSHPTTDGHAVDNGSTPRPSVAERGPAHGDDDHADRSYLPAHNVVQSTPHTPAQSAPVSTAVHERVPFSMAPAAVTPATQLGWSATTGEGRAGHNLVGLTGGDPVRSQASRAGSARSGPEGEASHRGTGGLATDHDAGGAAPHLDAGLSEASTEATDPGLGEGATSSHSSDPNEGQSDANQFSGESGSLLGLAETPGTEFSSVTSAGLVGATSGRPTWSVESALTDAASRTSLEPGSHSVSIAFGAAHPGANQGSVVGHDAQAAGVSVPGTASIFGLSVLPTSVNHSPVEHVFGGAGLIIGVGTPSGTGPAGVVIIPGVGGDTGGGLPINPSVVGPMTSVTTSTGPSSPVAAVQPIVVAPRDPPSVAHSGGDGTPSEAGSTAPGTAAAPAGSTGSTMSSDPFAPTQQPAPPAQGPPAIAHSGGHAPSSADPGSVSTVTTPLVSIDPAATGSTAVSPTATGSTGLPDPFAPGQPSAAAAQDPLAVSGSGPGVMPPSDPAAAGTAIPLVAPTSEPGSAAVAPPTGVDAASNGLASGVVAAATTGTPAATSDGPGVGSSTAGTAGDVAITPAASLGGSTQPGGGGAPATLTPGTTGAGLPANGPAGVVTASQPGFAGSAGVPVDGVHGSASGAPIVAPTMAGVGPVVGTTAGQGTPASVVSSGGTTVVETSDPTAAVTRAAPLAGHDGAGAGGSPDTVLTASGGVFPATPGTAAGSSEPIPRGPAPAVGSDLGGAAPGLPALAPPVRVAAVATLDDAHSGSLPGSGHGASDTTTRDVAPSGLDVSVASPNPGAAASASAAATDGAVGSRGVEAPPVPVVSTSVSIPGVGVQGVTAVINPPVASTAPSSGISSSNIAGAHGGAVLSTTATGATLENVDAGPVTNSAVGTAAASLGAAATADTGGATTPRDLLPVASAPSIVPAANQLTVSPTAPDSAGTTAQASAWPATHSHSAGDPRANVPGQGSASAPSAAAAETASDHAAALPVHIAAAPAPETPLDRAAPTVAPSSPATAAGGFSSSEPVLARGRLTDTSHHGSSDTAPARAAHDRASDPQGSPKAPPHHGPELVQRGATSAPHGSTDVPVAAQGAGHDQGVTLASVSHVSSGPRVVVPSIGSSAPEPSAPPPTVAAKADPISKFHPFASQGRGEAGDADHGDVHMVRSGFPAHQPGQHGDMPMLHSFQGPSTAVLHPTLPPTLTLGAPGIGLPREEGLARLLKLFGHQTEPVHASVFQPYAVAHQSHADAHRAVAEAAHAATHSTAHAPLTFGDNREHSQVHQVADAVHIGFDNHHSVSPLFWHHL